MAEPTVAERAVTDRATTGRGVPVVPGNAGTYLGDVEVNGRPYARFRAEPGTWVSASMRMMGHDRSYPAGDGYGAYRGLVLSPDGRPLADPDRIRPGDQYLVPQRAEPRARADPAPGRPVAPVRPPVPRADAAPSAPRRLGLRPAPETLPPPSAGRRRIVDEPDLDPAERAALEQLLDAPDDDALIVEELRHLALEGIDEATEGRDEQERFGAGDNTVYAFVNDWVSERYAPHIGAWHNSAMLFRRMLEQIASGSLDDAIETGTDARAALDATRDAWDDYVDASLRLGEQMIGTVAEARRSGIVDNARLAVMGLGGGAFGAGRKLSEFVAGVVAMIVDRDRATQQFARSLVGVVDTAFRLARTYGKAPADFMPTLIDALSQQSRESLERLSKLPPDQQAWAVGEVFGEVEGNLVPLAAASSISGTLRAGALASTGAEGAPVLATSRGLTFAEAPALVTGRAAAATAAVADSVQLAGFTSAFALAAGGTGGGDRRRSTNQVVEGEVTTYGEYLKRGRRTRLEGHEVLPHSLLEDLGLAVRRGIGAASRNNPVLALPPRVHAVVGRFQRAFGVMYRSQRANMSVLQVIRLNRKALIHAGVPSSVVRAITRDVLRHAMNLRIIKRTRLR